MLAKDISCTPDHPFYKLSDFKLRHHEPLAFHPSLLVSSNYFNPGWSGLRRIKNAVMVRLLVACLVAVCCRLNK